MPHEFDRATIDDLRRRIASRAAAASTLTVPLAKKAFDRGKLHDAERLDEVADILDSMVEEVAFLLANGRLATPQEILEFSWKTAAQHEDLESDAA